MKKNFVAGRKGRLVFSLNTEIDTFLQGRKQVTAMVIGTRNMERIVAES